MVIFIEIKSSVYVILFPCNKRKRVLYSKFHEYKFIYLLEPK